MKKLLTGILLFFMTFPCPLFATEEGTRHITGRDMDMYFMDDKVFGTVHGCPLWAVYNCGSEINGKIDLSGTYHTFRLQYPREGDIIVTGNFGPLPLSLNRIEKKNDRVLYHLSVESKSYVFSIRYERLEEDHMVNSIIEGEDGQGNPIKLNVDGPLCPFATTGIILIVVGSVALSAG